MTATNPAHADSSSQRSTGKSVRLHYLDWLRVIAILGVFLFHAVHPFDMFPWAIKNAEQSIIVTLFIVFLAPWGMPLFFLLSGAGSWFALRRRSGRQYIVERVKRLIVPYIVGSLILTPIQLFIQRRFQMGYGLFEGTLWEFFLSRRPVLGPALIGWIGYHLWFLGFLFLFALIGLPVFRWLDRQTGLRLIGWLARLSGRRGGILIFILPLIVVQLALRPFFPAEHHWADFGFMLLVFILGYVLYADERFARAIRRDWPITLGLAVASSLFLLYIAATGLATQWMGSAGTPGFYLLWIVWCVNSWCWSVFTLNLGMRRLDFSNRWLRYGQGRIMPFFLIQQPVIFALAFYVVQWKSSLWVKLAVVVLGAFLVSLGLAELMSRLGPLRGLFGMKTRRR